MVLRALSVLAALLALSSAPISAQSTVFASTFDMSLAPWVPSGAWSNPSAVVPWRPGDTTNRIARLVGGSETTRLSLTNQISLSGDRLYEVAFYAKRSTDFRFLADDTHRLNRNGPRFVFSMPASGGQPIHEFKIDGLFDGDAWTLIRRRFGAPRAGTLDVSLHFLNFTGEIWIDDFVLRDVTDPLAPRITGLHPTLGSTQFHRVEMVGGNFAFPIGYTGYGGGSPTDSPKLFTTFGRDPDYVWPRSTPLAGESDPIAGQGFRAIHRATAGETVAATFAVHAYRPLDLALVPGDFVSVGGGIGFPFDGNARLLIADELDRKTEWNAQDLTYREALELLPERSAVSLDGQRTTVVWILVTVPAGVLSGSYETRIQVTGTAATGEVRTQEFVVRIEVSPFALVTPSGVSWGVDADSIRWDGMDFPAVHEEIADMAAHGIDVVGLGQLGEGLMFDATGSLTGFRFPNWIEPYLPRLEAAGIQGLVLKWAGAPEHEIYRRFYGMQPPANAFTTPWLAPVIAGYQRLMGYVDARVPTFRWWHFGHDEPHVVYPGEPDRLLWSDYQALYLPTDVELFSTTDVQGVDSAPNLARRLTTRCYVDNVCIRRREQAEQRGREALPGPDTGPEGHELWYYSGGSYSQVTGCMVRNRYINGFLFWKLYWLASPERRGATGSYNFTYRRAYGPSLYDDFDNGFADFPMTFGDHLGFVDTPQWEGLRQGVNDFRYAATFMARHDAFVASGSCAQAEFAAQRLAIFEALLDALPFALDTLYSRGRVDNPALDSVRDAIHGLILEFDDFSGGPEHLFSDGFEAGGLSAWTSATESLPGQQLVVTPGAALCGQQGLEVRLFPGAQTAFLTDSSAAGHPVSVRRHDASFRMDPATLSLSPGAVGNIFALRDNTAGIAILRLRVRDGGGGVLQVRAELREGATTRNSSWTSIPSVPGTALEVETVFHVGDPGLENGHFVLRVNGATLVAWSDVNNGQYEVDRALLGAILGFAGPGAGSSGALHFDDYRSTVGSD